MKKTIWTILLLLFVVFSCKKDESSTVSSTSSPEPLDTIFPLSYFPVYPGSTWKYFVNDSCLGTTDTVMAKADSVYGKHFNGTDTVYVPFYNNPGVDYFTSHSAIIGYNGLLSETLPVGSIFAHSEDHYHSVSELRVVAKDSSIVMYGHTFYPTIVIEQWVGADPPTVIWDRWFFTKDVGIIKYEREPQVGTAACRTYYLVDYHINK